MSDTGRTLLLAWGNPGRLDDGLGPAFAAEAATWGLDGLDVDSDYQLLVEDAERVARCRRVLFVDADRGCPVPFRVERVRGGRTGIAFSSHSVTPPSLLALARDLFGREPEAWLVGVRGHEFDEFGERLSAGARENLAAALRFVHDAVRDDRLREVVHEAPEVHHG